MTYSIYKNKDLLKICESKFPLYPYVLPKKIKVELDSDFKKIINLKYYMSIKNGLIFSDLDNKFIRLINIIYKKYYIHYSRYNVIVHEVDSFLGFIDNYLENSKDILEIGCFDGYILFKIKKKYKNLNLLGIDPNDKSIDIAKKHGISCICDFFPSPQLTTYFDVIFSCNVIEHVNDPLYFLRKQKEYLKKDGIIIFETPNVDWCIINNEPICFHPQHLNLFPKRYIMSILLRLNFKYYNILEISHRLIIIISNIKYSGMKEIKEIEPETNITIKQIKSFRQSFEMKQKELKDLFRKINSIIIWGAGSFTGNILALMENDFLDKIDLIIDSDLNKVDHEFLFFNKKIKSPLILKEKIVKNIVILSQYINEIFETIKNLDLNYSFNIYTHICGINKYFYDCSKNAIQKLE